MAAPAFLFCTESDLKAYLSETGFFSRADDDQDGSISGDALEQAGVDLCINLGTLEVCKYIQRRYLPAQLANSELIRYFSVVFSCAALCRRRGNPVPESLAEEVDLIISQLEDIRDGKLDVPDIGERAPRGPLLINSRADARYSRPLRRQDNQSSPRGAKSQQGRDYSDMYAEPR